MVVASSGITRASVRTPGLCAAVPPLLWAIWLLWPALLSMSCGTTSYKAASYKRTVTTHLEINSNVPSEVSVSDKIMGTTPLSFSFNYEEEVDRQVKTANYWETNPGAAAALTVLSFGTYLPFSFIPAEPISKTHAAGKFFGNVVVLRLSADGYETLEYRLEANGENKIVLDLSLVKKQN